MKIRLFTVLMLAVILLSSCGNSYDDKVAVICLTNDYQVVRLLVSFSISVSSDRISRRIGDTQDRYLVDYTSSKIEVFLLEQASTIDVVEFIQSISNKTLNKQVVEHISSLPRSKAFRVKYVNISILED